MMATRFFETSGTTYLATQRLIPEDQNPQVGLNQHFPII
jgi:hypothetical protein